MGAARTKARPDGGGEQAALRLFVTLNDGSAESDVRRALEVVDALAGARCAQIPGYVRHAVDAVAYRDGRAIRVTAILDGAGSAERSGTDLTDLTDLTPILDGLEASAQRLLKLRCQINFRHQHQDALTAR